MIKKITSLVINPTKHAHTYGKKYCKLRNTGISGGRTALSLLLTLVFVLGAFPGMAFAADKSAGPGGVTWADKSGGVTWADVAAGLATPQDMHDPNALVLGEDVSFRESHSKQYHLSNGEVAVLVYSDPVHFQKDGKWVDLDHTLTAKNGRYVNTDAPVQVSFAQNTADNTLFSFGFKDNSVRISLLGTRNKGTGEKGLTAPLSRSAAASIPAVSSLSDSIIRTPEEASFKGKTAAEISTIRPAYTTASLKYEAVAPGMDLAYTLSGSSVRKDITLASADAWQEPVFAMDTELKPVLREDNSIGLCNLKDEEILTILAPYMYDSAGETSMNVQYVLTREDGRWLLTLTLDEAWLTAKERVFPVVVDPTIEITGTTNVTDTMVREGAPTTAYNSMKYAVVGYSSTSSNRRNWGLYKMKALPDMPFDATLTSATLNVRQLTAANGSYSWSNSAVASMEISAKMVLSNWVAGATWNTRPSVDEVFPLDTKTVTAATEGQDFSFNIYDAYYAWKYGWYQFDISVGNWSIQLSRKTDSITTPNCYTSFYTSEHTTAANKPVFAFCYTTSSAPVSDGTYYLNNRYYGDYLRYASSAATASSGLISSLGNSIRWEIRFVDGGYVFRSSSDTTKYLGVPASTSSTSVSIVTVSDLTIPSRWVWDIQIANGGGCLVMNTYNSKYLYSTGNSVNTSSSTGSAGTAIYDSRVWRLASISYYGNSTSSSHRELSSAYYAYDLSLDVCDIKSLLINTIYSDVLWASDSDFIITISNTNIASTTSANKIEGYNRGECTVSLKHKVTDVTSTRTCIISVNSTFSSTMSKLQDLYDVALSYDPTPRDAALLTMQFIRRNKYNNDNWTIVAGSVDSIFVNNIANNNTGLYRYFTIESDEEFCYQDPAGGGYVDFCHLCATLNGLVYDSDGFKAAVAGEANINNLCGWAGDLQTLCIEVLDYTGNSNDYDTVYDATYNLIGDPEYSLSMMDLLADTDAYNVYTLLNSSVSNFISSFSNYYNNYSDERYTRFTNGWSRQQIYSCVRNYTTNIFFLWQDWPLLEGYEITNTQANAIAWAFTDFIWEKIQDENE